ncbi:MAG: 6-phosphogluconolactonase [Xanthomonadales bacterium]|nr:6-phosphogluconolactonase [Xanthomonadales bacterium]
MPARARNSADDLVRWHPLADAARLPRVAAERILAVAENAITDHDHFHLVLAGGNTPRAAYALLRGADTDWSRWHVWFGDERCLPHDDPGRNSRMAADAWLAEVPIPAGQVHVIPAERGAVRAAADYADALAGVGDFDLVLLGLGEDGHTASLFPGQDWGTATGSPDVLAVSGAPKPPPERVSLSAHRLSRAREVLFLVEGAAKHDAVRRWRSGADLPAAAIRAPGGVDVLVEAALLDAR